MEFDKELFVETMVEILSSLSPTIWIMLSISLGLFVVRIFSNLISYYSPSCNHVCIEEEQEEYVDEDDCEFEDRYNYDYFVNSVLDNNSDPIKDVRSCKHG